MQAPDNDTPGRFSLGREPQEDDAQPGGDARPEPSPSPSAAQAPGAPRRDNRTGLLALLLSVLLLIVLAAAYLELDHRVSQLSATGHQNIEGLTADLQSRFSSLSVQYAKLEEDSAKRSRDLQERLKRQTDGIGEDLGTLKAALQSAEKALQAMGSTKLNAEEFRKAALEIDKSLKAAAEASATAASRLAAVEGEQRRQAGETKQSLQVLQGELGQLRQGQQALQAEKLDRETLAPLLNTQKDNYQQMLNLLTRKLEARIDTLEGKCAQLERALRSGPSPRSPAGVPENGAGTLPPPAPLAPGRRGIVEQNIPD